MAIPVGSVRTPSMKNRWHRLGGFHPDGACELCGKILKSPVSVAIDHETYEFVTEAEARDRGDKVSLFDVGSDCATRIAKALSDASK